MNKNMFTTELKDKVLTDLISLNEISGSLDIAPWANDLGISPRILTALLEYFVRKGLLETIEQQGAGYNKFIELRVEAFDFVRAGGFAKEEENLLLLSEKLKLEIEALELEIPKGKFDIIMGLIGGITTSAAFFLNRP